MQPKEETGGVPEFSAGCEAFSANSSSKAACVLDEAVKTAGHAVPLGARVTIQGFWHVVLNSVAFLWIISWFYLCGTGADGGKWY